MVKISVSVVSYNTRDLLAEALRSVQMQQALDWEIVVVDNASDDGSAEMVAREFPSVRLLTNSTNRGFAAANNQAIAASTGEYVLLLNSDAVALPGSIEAMVGVLDARPTVAVVGGQLLNADGSFQSSYADFPTLLGELLLACKLASLVYGRHYPSYPPGKSQVERCAGWVSGAFLMVRRKAIASVGMLDEEYFMYTEETDWCYRMRKAGWQVAYLPTAKARHVVGASSRRATERRRGQIYRSKWLFLRKHRGPLKAEVFRAAIRGLAVLKLVGWAACTLRPASSGVARANVRSYAWLLSQF
jgi:N-acetylglucosaminyl-diphospho-decaprenol L-rhamnosyltransferase